MKLTTALALGLFAAVPAAAQDRHDQHMNGDRHDQNMQGDRHDNGMRGDRHDGMRGNGWRGHHNGWRNHRHCTWVWRHHRHIRVCR